MATSHLYQLPHLSEVGASVEVDAADCFVNTGSHWCPRVGTLMLSSVKHESSRLKSECSGPRGGCSVHLTVHELLGRFDGHGLNSPRGRPGGSSEGERGWPSHWAAHLESLVFPEALSLNLEQPKLAIG